MCQIICLLGYCTFPVMLGAIIIRLCDASSPWVKLIIAIIAFIWASLCNISYFLILF